MQVTRIPIPLAQVTQILGYSLDLATSPIDPLFELGDGPEVQWSTTDDSQPGTVLVSLYTDPAQPGPIGGIHLGTYRLTIEDVTE